jgi:hypothetical protein
MVYVRILLLLVIRFVGMGNSDGTYGHLDGLANVAHNCNSKHPGNPVRSILAISRNLVQAVQDRGGGGVSLEHLTKSDRDTLLRICEELNGRPAHSHQDLRYDPHCLACAYEKAIKGEQPATGQEGQKP